MYSGTEREVAFSSDGRSRKIAYAGCRPGAAASSFHDSDGPMLNVSRFADCAPVFFSRRQRPVSSVNRVSSAFRPEIVRTVGDVLVTLTEFPTSARMASARRL